MSEPVQPLSPPPVVEELVERFREHAAAYRRPDYNETELRRDFLDPFFEALGWDVANRQGHAEAYREVVHEDRVKVGGATKAPDSRQPAAHGAASRGPHRPVRLSTVVRSSHGPSAKVPQP